MIALIASFARDMLHTLPPNYGHMMNSWSILLTKRKQK